VSAVLLPAVWPRATENATKLLHVDPSSGRLRDALVGDLPQLLRPGDLLVVNDVGTLPASLSGTTHRGPVEVRLAGPPEEEITPPSRWPAVLFGAGGWRQRTEDRPAPPLLRAGDRIEFGRGELSAWVVSVAKRSERLVDLRFDRDDAPLWTLLHRLGRPVQYSHLCGPLDLWHVQTPYASRPWAVEMPSAGRALRPPLLRALRRRGVGIASLSHAAGLSSTGDPVLDALLPFPERTDLPSDAIEATERAKECGGRVVAVGTTVVRALEGRAELGPLRPGRSVTRLRIGPDHAPRVVNGLLTGLHLPGESHFELLQAFAAREVLDSALRHAAHAGYLGHEFGDAMLILPLASNRD
jgi:S-adenosylmethionine:tRNA ribosyltransferase-isomerase